MIKLLLMELTAVTNMCILLIEMNKCRTRLMFMLIINVYFFTYISITIPKLCYNKFEGASKGESITKICCYELFINRLNSFIF